MAGTEGTGAGGLALARVSGFTLRSWGLIRKMKHKGRPEELHEQSQVK